MLRVILEQEIIVSPRFRTSNYRLKLHGRGGGELTYEKHGGARRTFQGLKSGFVISKGEHRATSFPGSLQGAVR